MKDEEYDELVRLPRRRRTPGDDGSGTRAGWTVSGRSAIRDLLEHGADPGSSRSPAAIPTRTCSRSRSYAPSTTSCSRAQIARHAVRRDGWPAVAPRGRSPRAWARDGVACTADDVSSSRAASRGSTSWAACCRPGRRDRGHREPHVPRGACSPSTPASRPTPRFGRTIDGMDPADLERVLARTPAREVAVHGARLPEPDGRDHGAGAAAARSSSSPNRYDLRRPRGHALPPPALRRRAPSRRSRASIPRAGWSTWAASPRRSRPAMRLGWAVASPEICRRSGSSSWPPTRSAAP